MHLLGVQNSFVTTAKSLIETEENHNQDQIPKSKSAKTKCQKNTKRMHEWSGQHTLQQAVWVKREINPGPWTDPSWSWTWCSASGCSAAQNMHFP